MRQTFLLAIIALALVVGCGEITTDRVHVEVVSTPVYARISTHHKSDYQVTLDRIGVDDDETEALSREIAISRSVSCIRWITNGNGYSYAVVLTGTSCAMMKTCSRKRPCARHKITETTEPE